MAVALEEVWGRVKNVCKQNGLLILSVLAVVIGCLLGFFLRGKQLSEQVSWLKCPVVMSGPIPRLFPTLTTQLCHVFLTRRPAKLDPAAQNPCFSTNKRALLCFLVAPTTTTPSCPKGFILCKPPK